MSYRINTFCIRNENGKIFKLFSMTSSGDGSIYIHMPYCKIKKGYIFKCTAVYPKPGQWGKNYIYESFIADDTAKLSIHKSGLVQFSGNNILSGTDESGKIKGVGIYSAPLSAPIESGPTVAVSCWGIEDGFEKMETSKDNRLNIVLDENDFSLKPEFGKNPSVYLFEIFIFSPRTLQLVLKLSQKENVKWMTMSFPMYMHSGAIFTFPILELKNLKNLVGVLPFKVKSQFSEKMKFGYTINGPSGLLDKNVNDGKLYAIGCTYPKIFNSDKSLNYNIT